MEHQSRVIFRERWVEKESRIWHERERERAGAAGPREGWRLFPIIVKANDDLRQEQAVSQMVESLHRIFTEGDVGVWLRPYEILATSATAGILEAVPDTVSLHALKRNAPGVSLPDFFKRHFGAPGGVSLKRARSNFVESCAGYAIVCYLLQVKDRHNGNILLDAEGHLLHIDWGFVLGRSPGRNFGFESAPFKLTSQHVEVMGGPMSFSFQRFRNLCVRAFLEARRNSEKLLLLVEMLAEGNPDLPCFSHASPAAVCEALRERFLPGRSVGQCVEFVIQMVEDSMASWSTPLYDKFQRCCVGIF
ncbi:phosphatidylinositol 4-kinase-like protein [Tribonema minus]|uniref:1-phosphatidylinositol 4-kinase n=1 Tax=Tribonema minus TaxID=303371 RepID=A0A836CBJ7_9STRA|nr:phosphatidylinositol 4-kinase-like protein [Tribonema minus]